MPVLPNYFVSHQWLRELKRQHGGPFVAIDFVIADDEPVLASHYLNPPANYTASFASGVIMDAEDPRGYQVVVPRKIEASEVKKVRQVNRVVGWRYYPDAHGQPPCSCEFCQRSQFGGRKIRDRDSEGA